MFTQCPECHTAFRVTAPVLEAAQGRVRCGRCATVFNALSGFLNAEDPAAAPDNAMGESPPGDDEQARLSAMTTQTLLENSVDPGTDLPTDEELEEIFIEQPPLSADQEPFAEDIAPPSLIAADVAIDSDAETAEHEILDIDVEAARAEEAITLEGVNISIVNEATGEYRTNFAVEPPDSSTDEAPAAEDAFDEIPGQLRAELAASVQSVKEEFSPADFAAFRSRRDLGREAPPSRRRGWGVGSIVLILVLVIQAIHFYRERLVLSSVLARPLSGVYRFFGAELSPAWNLTAYQVKQWGAVSEGGPGSTDSRTLRVRASVVNTADRAQPYPVLRLVLEDRFGGRLGQRDVEPHDYLPDANASHAAQGIRRRLLGAGERADAEIAIVDPGADAVGFQIDVCLRGAGNAIRCANGAEQTIS